MGGYNTDNTLQTKHFSSLFWTLTRQRLFAKNSGVGTNVEPCSGRYGCTDKTNRLTRSMLKFDPRLFHCSVLCSSLQVALQGVDVVVLSIIDHNRWSCEMSGDSHQSSVASLSQSLACTSIDLHMGVIGCNCNCNCINTYTQRLVSVSSRV